MDEATAQEVKKGVSLPFVVVDAVCGTLIAIGVILIIVGAIKFFRFKVRWSPFWVFFGSVFFFELLKVVVY